MRNLVKKLSQKSTKELIAIKLKIDAKFEEELICTLKNDMRNLMNSDPTLESLKICILIDSFCPKYIMPEPRKYREVIRHHTEDRCKLCRKNDLWFHK